MPFFSIIVATLKRPSYANLVQSIRNQTFTDWELIARYDPDVNEYISRNLAAKQATGEYLFFTDDDCVLPSDYLAVARDDIDRGSWPSGLSGPVMLPDRAGNMKKIEQPTWGIGANMIIRAEYFRKLGGFEETWDLPYPLKGWRADTQIWWQLEDAYPGKLKYSPRLVVNHPEQMKSEWIPAVEEVFFRRHRAKYIQRFVPVDPRGCQFLLETQDLTPDERAYVLKCRKEMRKQDSSILLLDAEKEEDDGGG